ncbi:MAG TPA: NADPH:quinone oxidoreductase family protein, partial [Stellaceae bacterium]|nr:NADPH:quinone oxidoreductase family protein [Stellaceae bacterium]
RLRAAGVNFPDTLIIAGKYQFKPSLPFTPGVEAAGIVAEVAPDVARFRPGDRVITRQRLGGYAEEIVLPASQLTPLPAAFGFAEGATFMVAGLTAYHALVQRAALEPREVLLVHGAGGGVGLAAVEIGKRLGATVIAAASTDAKLAVAKSRGADHLVNTSREDFVEAVRRLTGGAGADVIYDPIGGAVLTQSLRCIAWQGRLLVVGFAGGTIPELPANRILLKGCSVIGVRAGEATRHDPAAGKAVHDALFAAAAEGHLRPHVSHTLPLARFAEAMRLLMSRQAIGRVALTSEG